MSALSNPVLFRRLWQQARPCWRGILGIFLLSLLSPPLALLTPLPLKIAVDNVLDHHPLPRLVAALLPDRLQPQPIRYGLVALVDGDGTVLRTLHGPAGGYSMITGVRQHGDTLWLGSLTEPGVARVSLSD